MYRRFARPLFCASVAVISLCGSANAGYLDGKAKAVVGKVSSAKETEFKPRDSVGGVIGAVAGAAAGGYVAGDAGAAAGAVVGNVVGHQTEKELIDLRKDLGKDAVKIRKEAGKQAVKARKDAAKKVADIQNGIRKKFKKIF